LLLFWHFSLLPSPALRIWLKWCCPVWWYRALVLCPGPASSCIRLSAHAHVLSWLLCILVHRKRGSRVAPLACYSQHSLVSLQIPVIWSLRSRVQV
jgi:hypothetical protein